ncbi:MAG: hypothetical protein AAGL49_04945 [Pseudomonadota bacterium]
MAEQVNWPLIGGSQTVMELYPIGTAFKKVSGVYVSCKSSNPGKWNAVYVGEAHDLNQRLNTALQLHQAWSCITRNAATHVCVRAIQGARRARLDLETNLRHSLNPLCNLQ